jgi:hypothetical protein
MWNLYPFYLYPTGIYATDGFLKRFDHVLGRPTDRTRRCDGHPSVVDPVTPDTVHASLLIFPEMLKLATDLRLWVSDNL